MSIYIKGMDMPSGCANCKFIDFDGEEDVCPFLGAILPSKYYRNDDCPLLFVPDHGRLIDADAIPYMKAEWAVDDKVDRYTISEMPTIIPADLRTKNPKLVVGNAEE